MIIELPDGTEVEFPDDTPPEKIKAVLSKKPVQMTGAVEFDPAEGMTGWDKFRAGAGKAFYDLARGGGQLLGMVDEQDIAESRKRDQALMESGSAKAGNVVGNIAAALPAVLIPGANTYAGSAAIGSALGALQPVTEEESRAGNMALGGLFGVGGQALGNAVGAGIRGVKAGVIDPLTDKGQQLIANRMLQRIATDPARAASAAARYAAKTPGVTPSLAEATLDPGIAAATRAMADPKAAGILTNQQAANRGAVLDVLRNIAGDDAAMNAAKQARSQLTGDLYEQFGQRQLQVDDALMGLLKRPAIRKAYETVANNARNMGREIPGLKEIESVYQSMYTPNPNAGTALTAGTKPGGMTVSGEGMNSIKKALDAFLTPSGRQVHGIDAETAAAYKAARGALVDWLGPDYKAILNTYTQASRPINQMQIGQKLYDDLVPALSQYGDETTRMTPQTYARALKSADAMAQKATGFKGARLKDVMEPDQMSALEGIAEDLARASNAAEKGKAVGSNTSQNLYLRNLAAEVMNPMGAPKWSQMLVDSLARRVPRALTSMADEDIQLAMAQILADPQAGVAALTGPTTSGGIERIAEVLRHYALPVSVGAGFSQ